MSRTGFVAPNGRPIGGFRETRRRFAAAWMREPHLRELDHLWRFVRAEFGHLLRLEPVDASLALPNDLQSAATACVEIASKQFGFPTKSMQLMIEDTHEWAAEIRIAHGRVTLAISREFGLSPRSVLALVAHEVGHCVMESRGIRRATMIANEECADAVAILAGFGFVMMTGYYIRHQRDDGQIRSVRLGYLHPAAVAYLTLLRNPETALMIEHSGDMSFWMEVALDACRSLEVYASGPAAQCPMAIDGMPPERRAATYLDRLLTPVKIEALRADMANALSVRH